MIEIVPYKQNIEEWSPKLFQENANLFVKDRQSYEYKLYQTNLLNTVCYEYALNQIENRIFYIEDALYKVSTLKGINLKFNKFNLFILFY